MFASDFLNISLSHLSSIGLRSGDKPSLFTHANTIKGLLADSGAHREIKFYSPGYFEIITSSGDYIEAVYNDLYFGSTRVAEQCRNVERLLSCGAQPAWLLVTAYYAAFFMAVDISKANGRFVTNLSQSDFEGLLENELPSFRDTVQVEANNSFFVSVDHGQMSGEISLKFRKSSPKPHQITWSAFGQLANKLSISDDRLTQFQLLKSIISSDSDWENPSVIRNTWNYTQANYFGDKGVDLAKTFVSIIKSPKSSFGWARNNNLRPTQENCAASIAYVYHTLKAAHESILNRLKIAS